MCLEVLNYQERCAVDDFSSQSISMNVQGTVFVVAKH